MSSLSRRPAGPWRFEWLLAGVLVLLLVGTATVLTGHQSPASPSQPDRGCSRAFPMRLTPGGEGLYDSAIARFVICQDRTGTATLLRNATAAVWVVERPRDVTVHRERSSTIDSSFLEIVDWPAPVVLPGARVAVPAPASELQVRVEPRLTIAALAHERLASSLLATAPPGFRGPALTRGRTALASCLGALLELIPVPGAVLVSGNPGRQISAAAVRVASTPDSACAREWTAAKRDTGVPGLRIIPLAREVALWPPDAAYTFRALDAAITYSALGQRLFP